MKISDRLRSLMSQETSHPQAIEDRNQDPNPEQVGANASEPSGTTKTSTSNPFDEWPEQPAEAEAEDIDHGEAVELLITRDQLAKLLEGAFAMGGVITIPPFPLQSIPIAEAEQPAFQEFATAVYELTYEYAPWLLRPESKFLQLGLPIIVFGVMKAQAVRAELAGRRTGSARRHADMKPEPKGGDRWKDDTGK